MAIFLHFAPMSSHLHPLQIENCDSNLWLVVDEEENSKLRLERVNLEVGVAAVNRNIRIF